jgi:hypothetical protein
MGRYAEALAVSRTSRRVLAPRAPVQLAQLETNVGILYYRPPRAAGSKLQASGLKPGVRSPEPTQIDLVLNSPNCTPI